MPASIINSYVLSKITAKPLNTNKIPVRTTAVAAAVLAIIDGELKILMLKRTKDQFWSYVSGSIEADETTIEAVIREIKEETNASIERLYSADYIVQFFDVKHNCLMVVPAFVAYLPNDTSILINKEHTDYRWCSLAEAKAIAAFPNQRVLLDHVWFNFVQNLPSRYLKISL